MKILSITAQKPHSTGSGVYLTELVKNWAEAGHEQSVVGGVYEEDQVDFPDGVKFYPVFYQTEALPFAITGMSDEMPYESTCYKDLTSEMLGQFREIFCRTIEDAALHREQKKEIERIFQVKEEKIKVAGVGYNDKIFFQTGEKKEKKESFQIIFAGKVSEKKGVCSLLRAFSYLPYPKEKLKVVLAGGHGPEEEYEQIQQLAMECRYPVQFLGMLSQAELAEQFRKSDVFILPSFFEGLALVNIEAMACGCKVVCSDIPGMKDWFEENVPGEQIAFVKLPRMENTDEPVAEELPAFEQRLAEALQQKLEQTEEETPQLSQISWRKISECVLG